MTIIEKAVLSTGMDTSIALDVDGVHIRQPEGSVWLSPDDFQEIGELALLIWGRGRV
jgi:hypothetical protein